MSKYNVELKILLLQGLSKPEFYGDLVYNLVGCFGLNGPLRQYFRVGRKNPQKLTQLSSRSHPRHLVGKKDSTVYIGPTLKERRSDR